MAFKKDIPDWVNYCDNHKYHMKTIPEEFWDALDGIALRSSKSDKNLVSIINHISGIIPCATTKNWGGDYLRHDLSERIDAVREKVADGRIPVLMDSLAVLIEVGRLSCDDINELLSDYNIGYECHKEKPFNQIVWSIKDGNDAIIEEINQTQKIVKDISEQAYEEYERAKRSLEESDNERARKDSVRSCLSALEAVIKEYGDNNDIKIASRNLRDSKSWGRDEIVKDGEALFNQMHRLYPDLRHGSIEHSSMDLEEAEYWIERFGVYIRYMQKIAQKNGYHEQ